MFWTQKARHFWSVICNTIKEVKWKAGRPASCMYIDVVWYKWQSRPVSCAALIRWVKRCFGNSHVNSTQEYGHRWVRAGGRVTHWTERGRFAGSRYRVGRSHSRCLGDWRVVREARCSARAHPASRAPLRRPRISPSRCYRLSPSAESSRIHFYVLLIKIRN